MSKRSFEKKPLYRRVNTRTHGVSHRHGKDFRHDRNTKAEKTREATGATKGKMKQGVERGLDYTPLFKFLLSKVGQPWDAIHSEAVSRLDKEEPIFWMVSLDLDSAQTEVRVGESTYYSGLYVDDNGLLQKTDPSLTAKTMEPSCHCCTHTFNGEVFGIKKTEADFIREWKERR